MNDLMQDVRDYLTDRFSSPLWLSIMISWLLINWRLPITAIFESDRFNVSYINFYIDSVDHWCLITLPILFGLAYSIFSSSAKETLEVLSKSIRSLISRIDRKGIFYKSISLTEHEKQLSRLHRQIKKNEKDKEELVELSAENTRLENEIIELKNKIKTLNDYEKQNQNLAIENGSLIEQMEKLNNTFTDIAENPIKANNTQKPTNKNDLDNASLENNLDIKQQLHDQKQLTYIEKIKSFCNEKTISSFDDANSRTNLLVILKLLDNGKLFRLDEIRKKSGIKNDIFIKTYNLASTANLITTNNQGITALTDSGIKKIYELQNDQELIPIANAIETINETSKNEILFTLQKRSLSLEEIRDAIAFNQNTRLILNQLVNENKIHTEGSIFFYGPKPK